MVKRKSFNSSQKKTHYLQRNKPQDCEAVFLRKKKILTENATSKNSIFQKWRQNKDCWDKQKLREFITTRAALQEVLQAEGRWCQMETWIHTKEYGAPGIVNVRVNAKNFFSLKNKSHRTSLVVQWIRTCLPMQGTQLPSLVREDPTCCGATKPMLLSPRTLEPVLCNKRSHCNEKPAHLNERKPMHSNEDPAQPKVNK